MYRNTVGPKQVCLNNGNGNGDDDSVMMVMMMVTMIGIAKVVVMNILSNGEVLCY